MSPKGQVDAVLGIMGQLSGSGTSPPVSHMEVVASNTSSVCDLRPMQDQWREPQWWPVAGTIHQELRPLSVPERIAAELTTIVREDVAIQDGVK